MLWLCDRSNSYNSWIDEAMEELEGKGKRIDNLVIVRMGIVLKLTQVANNRMCLFFALALFALVAGLNWKIYQSFCLPVYIAWYKAVSWDFEISWVFLVYFLVFTNLEIWKEAFWGFCFNDFFDVVIHFYRCWPGPECILLGRTAVAFIEICLDRMIFLWTSHSG